MVAPDVGGGFGGKGSLYPEEIFVCAAARRLGRPVKWTSDRMEDLAATSQGFDEIVDAELALDATAGSLALRADVIGDVGAYSIYPWTAALEPVQVVSFLPGPYRIAALSRPRAGGGDVESADRALSRRRPADLDLRHGTADGHGGRARSASIRRRSGCAISCAPKSFPTRSPPASSGTNPAFRNASHAACDAIGYEALRAEQKEARAAGRWVGIGIASYAELTGIGSRISVAPGMPINTGTETATIRIDSTGASDGGFRHRLARPRPGDDAGAGRRRAISARVSRTSASCRATAPPCPAAPAPMPAAARCSPAAPRRSPPQAVREKVFNAASHLLEASAADLVAADGTISVAGTDRSVTFREVARAVYSEMGRLPPEAREDLAATKTYDPVFGTTTSATHIATVEIDPETYEVRVDRFVVAEDCGRLINPLIVDGQVHGGVAQGIGAALYEEVVYDERGPDHDREPGRLSRAVGLRNSADGGRASRNAICRPRSAAFAAWAKAAPSARRRRSPTRSPTRCRRLASKSTNFP